MEHLFHLCSPEEWSAPPVGSRKKQDERHPKEAFLSAFIYDYFWGPSGSCTGPSTWRKRPAPASRTPWPSLFSTKLCESLLGFQAVENTQGTDYWLDLSLSF